MMRQHESKFLATLVAAMAVIAMTSSTALAGFLDQLEGLQLSKGAIHQYRFEGDDAASRQNDHGGLQVDLLTATGEGGSGTNDVNGTPEDTTDDVPWSVPAGDANLIGFEAGYDGSQAYRPQSAPVTSTFSAEQLAQRRSGAGFYSPSFTTPSMMTIEAVVRPEAHTDNGLGPHYVFQTRPGSGRGYYLAQLPPAGSRGTDGALSTIVGSDFNERLPVVPDYTDAIDPEDGRHWYYVAATFDLSGTNAIVDAYYADLTAGGPLVHSQDNTAFAATIGAGLVGANGHAGVGLFSRGEGLAQEFFYGSIDNLAIFDSKLSAGDIAQSHRALTIPGVPEPATLALVALAGLALGFVRRR